MEELYRFREALEEKVINYEAYTMATFEKDALEIMSNERNDFEFDVKVELDKDGYNDFIIKGQMYEKTLIEYINEVSDYDNIKPPLQVGDEFGIEAGEIKIV